MRRSGTRSAQTSIYTGVFTSAAALGKIRTSFTCEWRWFILCPRTTASQFCLSQTPLGLISYISLITKTSTVPSRAQDAPWNFAHQGLTQWKLILTLMYWTQPFFWCSILGKKVRHVHETVRYLNRKLGVWHDRVQVHSLRRQRVPYSTVYESHASYFCLDFLACQYQTKKNVSLLFGAKRLRHTRVDTARFFEGLNTNKDLHRVGWNRNCTILDEKEISARGRAEWRMVWCNFDKVLARLVGGRQALTPDDWTEFLLCFAPHMPVLEHDEYNNALQCQVRQTLLTFLLSFEKLSL